MTNIISFNIPEISSTGITIGLVYATTNAVDKMSGLLDKINPINKLIQYIDSTTAHNVAVYEENKRELEQLDRDINDLR